MLFQIKNIAEQACNSCNNLFWVCLQFVYHSYICFIIFMVHFIDYKSLDFIPRKTNIQ